MSQPLETTLKLLFSKKEKDVTSDLLPDLLAFSYEDKETNEADEISITLKDREGKWATNWKPDGGEVVRAYISTGYTDGTKKATLNCGKFFVDSLRISGSPRVFELRAVSIPLNKPIRKKLKSKAWEKKNLKSIAQEISSGAGVKLLFDSQDNPEYDRQDQKKESDLKFLSRLCEDAGLSMKVTDERIVIFDQSSYEKKKAVKTFTLGTSPILSWDFESQQSETYKTCTVSYRDPKKKKKGSAGGFEKHEGNSTDKKSKNPAINEYTYTDTDADENGQELHIKKRASSLADAQRIAKAELRKANLRKVTGNMSVIGDVSLVAGIVVAVKGFGSIDGNFIVESAGHTVGTSGYTTSLTLRRVNSKY